jgi:hypothetical protein
MSLPYTIEIADCVLLKWQAEPSYDMCRRALGEVLAHPNFRKGMAAIAICGQSPYNPPGLELRNMAIDLGELREDFGPMALVVSTQQHFELGSMLRSYCLSQGLCFEVFRDVAGALTWVRSEARLAHLAEANATG